MVGSCPFVYRLYRMRVRKNIFLNLGSVRMGSDLGGAPFVPFGAACRRSAEGAKVLVPVKKC